MLYRQGKKYLETVLDLLYPTTSKVNHGKTILFKVICAPLTNLSPLLCSLTYGFSIIDLLSHKQIEKVYLRNQPLM